MKTKSNILKKIYAKLLSSGFRPVDKSLPLPLLRHGTSTSMADKEKRRSAVIAPGVTEGRGSRSESDREFLSQAGVGELIRGAILKMVEARSDDPIGFLADHFCNLASMTDSGTVGCGSDADQLNNGPLSAGAREQQHLNRALWHLRLAHHSQRLEHFSVVMVPGGPWWPPMVAAGF